MADTTNVIKSKLGEASEASQQTLTAAKDAVATAAGYVADHSKQAVGVVAHKVALAGSYLEKQAEDATDAMSSGFKTVARSIRQNAPQEGQVGDAATSVAQTFSNAAGYLDREGFEGLAKNITHVIKNSPLPALILGIGFGFLVARALEPRR